ncbi:MAG: hypothetical protein H6Q44_911 [Deltaproteobacteria bacterium]|jgi:hypothetical protein|nr:hypothetical protein [Deltaproteobacteria bacterium]
MSQKEIIKALENLRKDLQTLQVDFLSFKEKREKFSELKGVLRRRELDLFRQNPAQLLCFPPGFSPAEKGRFYELFKKYSFRLFLREILLRKGIFRISEVVRFSTPDTGRKYLQDLMELGLAEALGDSQYRLCYPPPPSLGPTLEWFMAEVLRREFSCPALYGLRCRGGRYGGDYDVVALLEGSLLYLEVKSSPPKNIEGDEVHAFLTRLKDLIPHLAIFFVDTELRLKDKIVPFFETELFALGLRDNGNPIGIQKIGDEIFFAPPRVYILGSRRSIVKNLGICFHHHFAYPHPFSAGWGFDEPGKG